MATGYSKFLRSSASSLAHKSWPNDSRRQYTKEDDEHLIEYIAQNNPQEKGRQGPKLYSNLANNVAKWPWSKNHPPQSWLQRYRDNKEWFDRRIYRYLKQQAREQGTAAPQRPARRDPTAEPTKSQRVPFTDQDDILLIKYLAVAAPNRQGRHGDNLYKNIVDNPGKYPWAQTHPWSSWQQRYKKNWEWFDAAIQRFQRKKGIDPNKPPPKALKPKTVASRKPTIPLEEEESSEVEKDVTTVKRKKRQATPPRSDQPPQKKRRIGPPPPQTPRRPPPEIIALRQEEEEESQPNDQSDQLPSVKVEPPSTPACPAPSHVEPSKETKKASSTSVPPPDNDYSNSIFDREESSDEPENDEEVDELDEEAGTEEEKTRVVESKEKKRSPSLEYMDHVSPSQDQDHPYPDIATIPSPNHPEPAEELPDTNLTIFTPAKPLPESQEIPTSQPLRVEDSEHRKVSQAPTPPTSHGTSPRTTGRSPTVIRQRTPDTATATRTLPQRRRRRKTKEDENDWFESSPSVSPTPRKRAHYQAGDEDEHGEVEEENGEITPVRARQPPVLIEGPFSTAFTDSRGAPVFNSRGKRRRSGVDEQADELLSSEAELDVPSPPKRAKAKTDEAWPPKRGKERGKEMAGVAQAARPSTPATRFPVQQEHHPFSQPSQTQPPRALRAPAPGLSTSEAVRAHHHDFSQATQVVQRQREIEEREEEVEVPRISDTQRNSLNQALAMLARPPAPPEPEPEPEPTPEQPEPPAPEESHITIVASVRAASSDNSELSAEMAVEQSLLHETQTPSSSESPSKEEISADGWISITESQNVRLQDALDTLRGVSRVHVSVEEAPSETGDLSTEHLVEHVGPVEEEEVPAVPRISESQHGRLQNALAKLQGAKTVTDVTQDELPSEQIGTDSLEEESVQESPPLAPTSPSRVDSISPPRHVRPVSKSPTAPLPHVKDSPFGLFTSKGKEREHPVFPPPPTLKHRFADRRHTLAGFAASPALRQLKDLRSHFSAPASDNVSRASFTSSAGYPRVFEGKEVTERDFVLAMDTILRTIARNHGFEIEVARQIWKATGNLEATDVALKKMREAAESIGQSFVEEYQEKSSMRNVFEYVPLSGTKAAAARTSMGGFL